MLRNAHRWAYPPRSIRSVSVAVALFAVAAVAPAQDELDDPDAGVVLETPFRPGVEPNAWELGLQLGFMNLDQTLLAEDDIVFENESDGMLYSDMELRGEFGFHPRLFLNRSIGSHLVLENAVGFTVGSFQQSISGEVFTYPDIELEPEITETDIESGSYFFMQADIGISYFPKSTGRVLPFIGGGFGRNWMDLDTDYVDGLTSAWAFHYGGGLRIVADDLYSFRLEVRNFHTTMNYDVAPVWREAPNENGDAIEQLFVERFVRPAGVEPVTQFQERSYSSLSISAGFTAAF